MLGSRLVNLCSGGEQLTLQGSNEIVNLGLAFFSWGTVVDDRLTISISS